MSRQGTATIKRTLMILEFQVMNDKKQCVRHETRQVAPLPTAQSGMSL